MTQPLVQFDPENLSIDFLEESENGITLAHSFSLYDFFSAIRSREPQEQLTQLFKNFTKKEKKVIWEFIMKEQQLASVNMEKLAIFTENITSSKILDTLIACGLELNGEEMYGKNLIFGALKNYDFELVKSLIERGVDFKSKPYSGSMIKELENKIKSDFEDKNDKEGTEIELFTQKILLLNKMTGVYEQVLSQAYQYAHNSSMNQTTLKGHFSVIDTLIEHGLDINETDLNGTPPFMKLTDSGKYWKILSIAEYLIHKNIDLHAQRYQETQEFMALENKLDAVLNQTKTTYDPTAPTVLVRAIEKSQEELAFIILNTAKNLTDVAQFEMELSHPFIEGNRQKYLEILAKKTKEFLNDSVPVAPTQTLNNVPIEKIRSKNIKI